MKVILVYDLTQRIIIVTNNFFIKNDVVFKKEILANNQISIFIQRQHISNIWGNTIFQIFF